MTMATTQHVVLVIGTGSIGERHLRCLLATGRATVAFVEPRAEVRERVACDYGVLGYESLDAALDVLQALALMLSKSLVLIMATVQMRLVALGAFSWS